MSKRPINKCDYKPRIYAHRTGLFIREFDVYRRVSLISRRVDHDRLNVMTGILIVAWINTIFIKIGARYTDTPFSYSDTSRLIIRTPFFKLGLACHVIKGLILIKNRLGIGKLERRCRSGFLKIILFYSPNFGGIKSNLFCITRI